MLRHPGGNRRLRDGAMLAVECDLLAGDGDDELVRTLRRLLALVFDIVPLRLALWLGAARLGDARRGGVRILEPRPAHEVKEFGGRRRGRCQQQAGGQRRAEWHSLDISGSRQWIPPPEANHPAF